MTRRPASGAARIAIVTGGAILCAQALMGAQRPMQGGRPQATFRAGVELVQIDVVVLDEKGQHVRGLTARDFVVHDREKPQQIAAFEEVSHRRSGTPATGLVLPDRVRLDVATNHTVQSDRLIVMVVDDLHIWTGRTDIAKEIARGVLGELSNEATMAVLFTSGEGGVEPTADRGALFDAVDRMRGRQSIRRPNGAPKSGGGEGVLLQTFFDNMAKYKTLEDAARLLGGHDVRRKAFVLLSEGIAKDLTGVFESSISPCEQKNPLDPCYHDSALRVMMESLRRSNVVTYGIDPRGAVTSQDLALELFGNTGEGDDPLFRWDNPLRQAQDGLTLLSEASGGFAIVNSDDFTSGVQRIVEDLDHYYLLGFYPSDPKGRGYRPLAVEISGRPGWRVRFRKGYRPGGAPEDPKHSSALVALSSGVLPATGVAMRLSALPMARDSKETPVAIALEVTAPRDALLEADGRLRDELSYEILVVDEKKKKVKSAGGMKARVTLSANARDDKMPDAAVYQVTDRIELPPGRYQIRVSAQSAKQSAGGSAYLNLVVPDFRKDSLSIGGIALGYWEGPRIAAASIAAASRATPGRAVSRERAAPPPLTPFAPTLDRAFASSARLRVYFEVAAAAGAVDSVRGILELVDSNGGVRGSMAFTPDERGSVNLTLPLGTLSPGAYVMRVTAESGTAKAVREIGFGIVER